MNNDYGLWKMKMRVMLVKEGLASTLDSEDKLPKNLSELEKRDLLGKAYTSLILGLGDKIL